jgi:UDP-glucose 4-epimerase
MVTGGAGFIGSNLVDRLLAEGHDVDVVDDLSTGSLANLADARACGGALRFHHLDVRSGDLVDLVRHRRPEVIFHLAAQADVRVSVERPVFDAEVNVLGTIQVLEGARAAGTAKVVFAASGGTLYGEPEAADLPVDERQPHRPLSPYRTSTGLARTRTARPASSRSSPAISSPGGRASSSATAARPAITCTWTMSSTPSHAPRVAGVAS